MRIAWAEINYSALRNNYAQLKSLAPKSKVLAVLKANAYGHGMTKVARQLYQADMFGVARVDEALDLRAGGVANPILLMEGFFNASELPMLAASNIQTVIHHSFQLEALEQANLKAPISVWLKVDTGMNRLGINAEQFPDFVRRLNALPCVKKPVNLMTHFGCADDPENIMTQEQIERFSHLCEGQPGEKSLANSAGILAWPQSHADMIRPGILLYGVSPFAFEHPEMAQFEPVMSLKTSVISVKKIRKGEAVGYGSRWIAPEDTYLGVAGIGYGDGYPKHLPDDTPVLINGKRYGLAGAVSMDMICIDLGAEPEVAIGDEVTLWGAGLPIEEIAMKAGTIPYELLCNVTRRVTYNFINDPSDPVSDK